MPSVVYPKKGQRGTGRRKQAIARVRLVPGNGTVIINGKSMEDYFGARKALHLPPIQPLVSAELLDRYNVLVKASGGGIVGQTDAIKMGVARALASLKPDLHPLMRAEGFLTRDARVKESKKYGRKKARKRFQFSKR